jgi:NAD(P)-dependent dehydrogenase (short-subunit alcohol dehydrogenase family)
MDGTDGSVVVTGGGSGIGRATCLAFAAAGRAVAVGDVDVQAADRVVGEITAVGGRAVAVEVDVRDSVACVRLADEAERLAPLQVVVANAGTSRLEASLEETPDATVDELLAVNVGGVIRTVRAALPRLVDGGCVLVTSSVSGLRAHPGAVVYAATKTALIGFARSLAAEVAPRGIRVNAICPGGVDTPMVRRLYGDAAADPAGLPRNDYPLGRLATSEDVADAMVWLAGARHVTGVSLRVDGGEALFGAV